MVMTDETVVDVLEVAENVLVEVKERVKVSTQHPTRTILSNKTHINKRWISYL